ncbi:MAG: hypothetical protein J0M18_17335 [Ignavibacteria bacterium]|nr:hypothetical protein [Ignavibacteria bacterium]
MENQTEVKKAEKVKKHDQLKEEKDKSSDEFGHASAEAYKDKDKPQNLEEKEKKEEVIWHEKKQGQDSLEDSDKDSRGI